MTAEGENVDTVLAADWLGKDHGHFFSKKSFAKPTVCHHCVCNFTCHEKCLKTVASYCSAVASQLIKNPVAHSWAEPSRIKDKVCCVCRKRTDGANQYSLECEVCEYYVHVDCADLAVSDCKEAAAYGTSSDHYGISHQWREGNLPPSSKCAICRKSCSSSECLAGLRCMWCGTTAHPLCYKELDGNCALGLLRPIMLPPNALSIPRTELPMAELLNISRPMPDEPSPGQLASTSASGGGDKPAGTQPTDVPADPSSGASGTQVGGALEPPPSAGGGRSTDDTDEHKEKDEMDTVRVFDGDHALETNQYKLVRIANTGVTVQQVKELALRQFHIVDDPCRYYLHLLSDSGTDAGSGTASKLNEAHLIATAVPRLERCKLCIRSYDADASDISLRVYMSWLKAGLVVGSIVFTV